MPDVLYVGMQDDDVMGDDGTGIERMLWGDRNRSFATQSGRRNNQCSRQSEAPSRLTCSRRERQLGYRRS
jgi:hypothetical protein